MGDSELSQDELDLAQFASLLDTCLTSDNEAVQNALRGLLTIATIVTAKKPGDELVRGPLRSLIDQVERLNSKVSQLEFEANRNRNGHYGSPGYPGKDYYGSPAPNTWPGIVDPNYNQPYRPFTVGDTTTLPGVGPSGWPVRPFTVGDDINDKGASATSLAMIEKLMRKLKE